MTMNWKLSKVRNDRYELEYERVLVLVFQAL